MASALKILVWRGCVKRNFNLFNILAFTVPINIPNTTKLIQDLIRNERNNKKLSVYHFDIRNKIYRLLNKYYYETKGKMSDVTCFSLFILLVQHPTVIQCSDEELFNVWKGKIKGMREIHIKFGLHGLNITHHLSH